MPFQIEASIPVLTVFVQGLLSFFSPCVLPLVPLYLSYLAGGSSTTDENGQIQYPRRKILINTLFFILGISFAFFLLGLGFTALGRFFSGHRMLFARISGIVMILFGLLQFGVLGKPAALEQEHRLPFRMEKWAMGPLVAAVLGFTFSFAWTPCVGPTLSSVLLMASSAQSTGKGFLLIGVYTLGFVLPFLAVGLFTGTVLNFLRTHRNVVRYTAKVGAALLVLMGIMTLTGFMNGITGYLSGAVATGPEAPGQSTTSPQPAATPAPTAATAQTPAPTPEASKRPEIPAPDFTLIDQYGEEHTLSEYKGKTVFLNFWATWCSPCKMEMPEIQALYERYGGNKEDLVVLGVANPKTEQYRFSQDVEQEKVVQFLRDGGYTFPVVLDASGEVFAQYGIQAFPTTFMIDSDGNVFGYVNGMLTAEMMESIVQQTMTGVAP